MGEVPTSCRSKEGISDRVAFHLLTSCDSMGPHGNRSFCYEKKGVCLNKKKNYGHVDKPFFCPFSKKK